MTTSKKKKLDRLGLLRACLDEFDGRYAALRGAPDQDAAIKPSTAKASRRMRPIRAGRSNLKSGLKSLTPRFSPG